MFLLWLACISRQARKSPVSRRVLKPVEEVLSWVGAVSGQASPLPGFLQPSVTYAQRKNEARRPWPWASHLTWCWGFRSRSLGVVRDIAEEHKTRRPPNRKPRIKRGEDVYINDAPWSKGKVETLDEKISSKDARLLGCTSVRDQLAKQCEDWPVGIPFSETDSPRSWTLHLRRPC